MIGISVLRRAFDAARLGLASSTASPAPPAAGLDVGTIKSLATAEVELRHPVTGEPLGAFVTLASPDHPQRRQALRDIAQAQRARGEVENDEAIELMDETAAELLSRIVLGWRGFKEDGKSIEWSPAAVRALLSREEMRWLKNQILALAGASENFIEASASG